jgi:hypothetical protein
MTASRNLLAAAACLAFAACSSSSDDVSPPPPPTQHLYVGDDATTGSLRSYALPLTASSTAVAAVPMNKPFTIGVNSTTLAVATLGDVLSFFTLPLTSASAPFATFAAGSDGTPLFVASGNLYQGGSGMINVYTPPFTNASVPSSTITTVGLSPSDLAIDPAGNIYETTGGNTIGVVTGTTLTTTLTAPVGIAFRGLAASSTQLFACGFLGSSNNVYIYTLPLTASATPAVTINLASTGPEGCALDSSGNLYVGAIGGQILVFAPPFTASSTPMLTLTTTAIIFGIAVGP